MLSIKGSIGYSTPLGDVEKTFLPGTICGVRGPNGSGKSTLLASLAGEINLLGGTAEISGLSVTDLESTGKVIHISSPDFYPDLSIGEHLRLLAKTGGLNFESAVSRWELSELVVQSSGQLSSGQRQRSYLATQLGLNAEAFLLDEPERHLDAHWLAVLCSVLQDKASSGLIVVIASHSPVLLGLCDDVLDLEQ